ncbi:hypothetical protein SISSUDRAFT_1130265 [Sistotremastrum suecicum HHB10207 ss-3]|uniref:Uncharacterized protein n=1 Tax=Sistotremastrum suecicum HHB10207 ss-3 TaxID=1314776 RepID=A0A166BQ19_9AGAM|nr:hypothetical protein SISSUDRAFT_1130265 [Sistotremastrum suecicum HHB10207 ss-3]
MSLVERSSNHPAELLVLHSPSRLHASIPIIILCSVVGAAIAVIASLVLFSRFKRIPPAPLPPVQRLAHERKREEPSFLEQQDGLLPFPTHRSTMMSLHHADSRYPLFGDSVTRQSSFITHSSRTASWIASSEHPTVPTLVATDSSPASSETALEPESEPRPMTRHSSLSPMRARQKSSVSSIRSIRGAPHNPHNRIDIVLPTPLAPTMNKSSSTSRLSTYSDQWTPPLTRSSSYYGSSDSSGRRSARSSSSPVTPPPVPRIPFIYTVPTDGVPGTGPTIGGHPLMIPVPSLPIPHPTSPPAQDAPVQ